MEFLPEHAQEIFLRGNDGVFGAAKRAQEAKARGEKVYDGTIGIAYGDDGEPFPLDEVTGTAHDLLAKSMTYAPIVGTPDYRKLLPRLALGSHLETVLAHDRQIDAFATAGGTGALKLAIHLFATKPRSLLTGGPHWESYSLIANEEGVKCETFPLLNFEAFKNAAETMAERDVAFTVLVNAPCQNPTGFTPSNKDWENFVGVIEPISNKVPVTVIVDLAYHAYARDPEGARAFLPLLSERCPKAVLALALSNSKTYTCYGWRAGGLIVLHPKRKPIKNLEDHARGAIRATDSNNNHLMQLVISTIENDSLRKERTDATREQLRTILLQRGDATYKAAQEYNVPIIGDEFEGGFFAFVPIEDDRGLEVAAALEKTNVFFLGFPEGLRVGVCGMKEADIPEAIKITKKVMDQVLKHA